MTSFSVRRIAMTAAPALFLATSALAQVAVPPPPRPDRSVTTVPCCRCIGEATRANVSTGSSGAVWTVTGPGSTAAAGTVPASNVAWTTTVIPGAGWISPVGSPSAVGTYSYQTRIDLRNCVIPSNVTISGRFLADNRGTLFVNGREVVSSAGTPNYGFLPGSLTTFNYALPAGTNGIVTIELRAQNSGGPTGIQAEVTVTRQCGNERDLEVPPRNR